MHSDNKNRTKLYFIAIVPPDEICNEVTNIKEDFAKRYESKAALKSPPHITIIPPFHFNETSQFNLTRTLDTLCKKWKSFSITLENFRCFAPRVIYINVLRNDTLNNFYEYCSNYFEQNLGIVGRGKKKRAYHPHMTVAFSDLSEVMFYTAWKEYKRKSIDFTFECTSCHLLKHNGQSWDIMHSSTINTNS